MTGRRIAAVGAQVATIVGCVVSGGSLGLFPSVARAYGPVDPYLNGAFPATSPSVEWGLVDAFPALEFPQPIQLVSVPRRNMWAVLSKAGLVHVVEADETASVKLEVLDIRSRVQDRGDGGTLGIAFHPDFGLPGASGERSLYVYYRYLPDSASGEEDIAYNRLSRFEVDPTTLIVDPSSEEVLFQQFDPHDWHNGGCLRFGNDGFLYVSVGDVGHPDVAEDSYQQLDKYLTSGVLRIDVDGDPTRSHPIRRQPQSPPGLPADWPPSYSQGYLIPDDNPWLSESGDYLEEFYSIGLRSPHRMAFDPQTGDLWLGDAGHTSAEEIDIVQKGGNYQWAYREGFVAHSTPPNPLIGVEQPPVYAYGRGAVVGGFVYRAARHQSRLGGKYLFTDFNSGRIEALEYHLATDSWEPELVTSFADNGIGLALVGVENVGDGHVYVLGYGNPGKIFRLEPLPPEVGEVPSTLSEVGAFVDLASLEPTPALIEYDVNTPLWSDGAAKRRWAVIPNDGVVDQAQERVVFEEDGPWAFPAGTVFVKHFELPVNELSSERVRLETRFLVVTDDGSAYGLTYRWNEAGTEAYLLAESETRDVTVTRSDGSTFQQAWSFPSPQQCLECHTASAGYSLGLRTWQLNRVGSHSGMNQLLDFQDHGLFANPFDPDSVDGLPRGRPLSDSTASPAERINSYLAGNCGHCHLPGGVPSSFDARFSAPLNDVVGRPSEAHSSTEPHLVQAGDRWSSELFVRDASLGTGAMPPLAKNIVDDDYVSLLGAWIDALPLDEACVTEWLAPASLTAVSATTEDPSHPPDDALDGLAYTVWHTEWRNGYAPPPHEIVIDLGQPRVVDALRYLPRQDPATSGTVTAYELYLSEDGSGWGSPVSVGTWPGDKTEKVAQFPATRARHARWVAAGEVEDRSVAVAAELGFRTTSCEPTRDGGSCDSAWASPDEWSIAYVDSIDAGSGEPEGVFDGLPFTVWHTAWRDGVVPPAPHEIVIDLGHRQWLDGFSHLPRQDPATAGTVADYEVYVGDDLAWGAPVVSGTFPAGKDLTVVDFPAAQGRYFRFVAARMVGDRPETVVAELGVRTRECEPLEDLPGEECDPSPVSRDGWSVTSVDSVDVGFHAAEDAIDGDTHSVWHTAWRDGVAPPHPHEIVIDLGAVQKVDGLSYLPRQDSGVAGSVAEYEIYLSDAPDTWGAPLAVGSFDASKAEQAVMFPRSSGRFLRFVALGEVDGRPVTVVSELNLLSTACP